MTVKLPIFPLLRYKTVLTSAQWHSAWR